MEVDAAIIHSAHPLSLASIYSGYIYYFLILYRLHKRRSSISSFALVLVIRFYIRSQEPRFLNIIYIRYYYFISLT